MRLLNTNTLKFQEFYGAAIPKYAILSHRWGGEEVSYKEFLKYMKGEQNNNRAGLQKILSFCRYTARRGHHWAWIDSCCIDKRSSAELTEAINSMYKWYSSAAMCYAYLSDVRSLVARPYDDIMHDLKRSAWFTRGWTLQEMLAPDNVEFLTQEWEVIGWKNNNGINSAMISDWNTARGSPERVEFSPRDRSPQEWPSKPYILTLILAEATGIPEGVLISPEAFIPSTSIANKMRWAADRETSREEDLAYSLLGLFDINMPLLYGEGRLKAFVRLQMEIMRKSADESIVAWISSNGGPQGLLAPLPRAFEKVRTLKCDSTEGQIQVDRDFEASRDPIFSMTRKGMRIDCRAYVLSKIPAETFYGILLNCRANRSQCVLIIRVLKNNEAMKWSGNREVFARALFEIRDKLDRNLENQLESESIRIYIDQPGFTTNYQF